MAVWTKPDGTIIVDELGRPIDCPDCPCDQGTCIADFVYTGNHQTRAMVFTDTSVPTLGETISSWVWDFDDGFGSTLQHPTHTYAADGSYNVTLTIIDTGGCTDSKTVTIVFGSACCSPSLIWPENLLLVVSDSGTPIPGSTSGDPGISCEECVGVNGVHLLTEMPDALLYGGSINYETTDIARGECGYAWASGICSTQFGVTMNAAIIIGRFTNGNAFAHHFAWQFLPCGDMRDLQTGSDTATTDTTGGLPFCQNITHGILKGT